MTTTAQTLKGKKIILLGASSGIGLANEGGSIGLTSGTAGARPGAGWSVATAICSAMEGFSSLVKRVGVPDDVAEGFIYLMKQRNGTGQSLLIDGGAVLV